MVTFSGLSPGRPGAPCRPFRSLYTGGRGQYQPAVSSNQTIP